MSLFEAPKGAVIVHAVNNQGVWGSGIAKDFKELYPRAYQDYKDWVAEGAKLGKGDSSLYFKDEPHRVGWICTSDNYGSKKDHPEEIKVNTTLALMDFCAKMVAAYPKPNWDIIDIYSNKFNSGLFAVPWEESEIVLATVLKRFKRINWIVCSNE